MIAASRDAASIATWTTPLRSTSCGLSMSPPAAMRDAWSRSSMMRSRVRALRSMISRARVVSAGSDPPCRRRPSHTRIAPSGVRSSWESSARNSSLRRPASNARCLAACSLSRSAVMSRMTQRLWTSRPSRKRPFAPISTRRMAPFLGPQARLVAVHRLPAAEPAEHVGGGLGLDEDTRRWSGRRTRARSTRAAPGPVSVRPEHAPVGIHPAHADRGVLEELDELLVALGWPRAVGRPVAHQLRRVARLATTVISSAGCTGLERCSWKPARSARRRSSVRA